MLELGADDIDFLDYIRAKYDGVAPKKEITNYYDCHEDIDGAIDRLLKEGVLERTYCLKSKSVFKTGEEVYSITPMGIAVHDYHT